MDIKFQTNDPVYRQLKKLTIGKKRKKTEIKKKKKKEKVKRYRALVLECSGILF